jgi:hypothetical protein
LFNIVLPLTPVTNDFGTDTQVSHHFWKIFTRSSNFCVPIEPCAYVDTSSTKADRLPAEIPSTPCDTLLNVRYRRRAFKKISESRGDRAEPWTVPVSMEITGESPSGVTITGTQRRVPPNLEVHWMNPSLDDALSAV